MATATATDLQTVESPEKPITALMKNAAVRQLIAMIAIAASVALGVAVILWTRAPTMGPLYVNLTDAQVSEVVAALQAAGIAHDIDSATGQITVEKSNVYETRMMLAGQGLPSSDEAGMEILSQEPQFGLSSLQERMRYEHAREIELSRSITTLKWVRAARVHIARANDSVFVRDRKPTTASVILDVATGQSLPQGHVEAIVHMVSSGILNLAPSDVTVVDQFGNLLSSPDDDENAARSSRQFDLKMKKEAEFARKVEETLAPMVGVGRYKATVNAELDFTRSQETSQLYDPVGSTVVSEQESVRENRMMDAEGGVPGALQNQPPVTGQDVAGPDGQGVTVSSSSDRTRNFDTGIVVRTRDDAIGSVLRMSVAVVVDNVRGVDDQGNPTSEPRTATQLADIERAVRAAVGLDAERGDTIEVVNSEFPSGGVIESPAPPEFWQEPWFLDMVRQGVGLLLALVVFFKILRPMARGVIEASTASLPPPPPPESLALPDGGALALEDASPEAGADSGSEDAEPEDVPPPTIEERIEAARTVATEDPERVARIMKDWVGDDDG